MDRTEAKLVLQAYRPKGEDEAHPVFAEAISLLVHDPELKVWWENQQQFDRKIAATLESVKPPPHLRTSILAGRKIEQMTPRYQFPTWLAIAAAFVLLTVAGLHSWISSISSGSLSRGDYMASVLPALGNDNPSLAMLSPHHEKIMAWLKERNAPMGQLPASLASMPSIGCETLSVHGHAVSLVCFSMASGQIAHLFVVDRQALADPYGSSPQFTEKGPWSMASWSDDTKSYLLVTQAGVDPLKHLL